MELEGVRELKQALREQITEYREGGALDFPSAAGRPEAVSDPGSGIALGAAPTEEPGNYRLAVRVQRRELLESDFLAEIVSAADGEADVAYIGQGFKQSAPVNEWRRRPLEIGCSIGHPSITAGTLGCFVETPGGVRLLSNNHVLADEDRAAPGDAIVQPGTADGGEVPADVVGTLDHVVPLLVGQGNYMDVATAIPAEEIAYEAARIPGFGDLAGVRTIDGSERLAKLGRTSGLTRGRVVGLELDDVSLRYEKGNVVFDGVIEIEGDDRLFTEGGDSGSLVVTDEPEPQVLALHFGGLRNGHSVAAPIEDVFREIGATLLR